MFLFIPLIPRSLVGLAIRLGVVTVVVAMIFQ